MDNYTQTFLKFDIDNMLKKALLSDKAIIELLAYILDWKTDSNRKGGRGEGSGYWTKPHF